MKNDYSLLIKKRIGPVIFFVTAFLLYKLAFLFPETVENVYSRGIYPVFATVFSALSSVFPFSLSEILLYCFSIYCLFYVIYIPCGLLKKGARLYSLISRLTSFICVILILAGEFMLGWAINYARKPISEELSVKTGEYTVSELKSTSLKLAKKANELRKSLNEDNSGVFKLKDTKKSVLCSVSSIYEKNADEYLYTVRSKTAAKGVLLKNFLSTFETTGIFSPFTFEANLNMQMPESYFPATVLHEYAHLQGFAREDECNFIAWYIAKDCDDTDFSYSGYILALTYALNALYSESPEYYKMLYSVLSDGVIRDLRQNSLYWKEFKSEMSAQANKVYSDYLEYSGVPDGQKSYGRMLDLIIAMDKAGYEI